MADGALSPVEAREAAAVLEAVGASLERRDLEARLAALEARGERLWGIGGFHPGPG